MTGSRVDLAPIHLHGPGRAGCAMATLLRRLGVEIAALSGGSAGGAAEAQRVIGGEVSWTASPAGFPNPCTLLIAVPDDALRDAALTLARLPAPRNGLALHLSGVYGRSVLEPLLRAGWRTAAFHPLRSFPARDPRGDSLFGCLVALEAGEAPDFVRLSDVARALAGEPFALEESQRALYHAGASVMSNHLLALLDFGYEALWRAGVPPDLALRGLATLGTRSLDSAVEKGIDEALTGPVVRGDEATITAHFEALKEAMPERRALYLELVRGLLRITRRRSDRERAAKVAAWLKDHLE